MKKIYLLAGALVGGFALNAQVAKTQSVAAQNDRNDVRPVTKKVQSTQKVEGQEWWANGFDQLSDWNQTTGVGHVSGDWAIVNSLPSNITSQQAGYQWPAAFSNASGNFALINSDAAGDGQSQDAYFEFTGNIDLSGAGNAPMYLTFAEYYRHYYDQNYVEVSNDGGATWTTFAVNPESEVPVNTNCVPNEVETVNITPAKGTGPWTNQVKIRFHYIGTWDWFWGVDDVKIVEAWNNDMKVTNWYQATDIATTWGVDYYHVPASQSSFPGLTFGAKANNNGGANQAAVTLNATATGGYTGTSAAVAIAATATDTLSISTPYIPTGLGTKTINLTTGIGAGTDADLTNNQTSMDVFVTNYEYSRDNNVQSGSISNVSSQPGQALEIGNEMEIFNNMTVTNIKLRLATQGAAAVGSEYLAKIYLLDQAAGEYVYLAETNISTILNTTAAWVNLPISGGPVTLNAGDIVLVTACHFGGATEVRFAYAQNTYEQSVIGYLADASLFSLSSPNAIMIRLSDDPSGSVTEVENTVGMNVYPNPANNQATVTFEVNNADAAAVNVTDLTGKVVYTTALGSVNGAQTVNVNTESLTNGVYMVNVIVDGSVSTQKLIVRK
jgi:hypothetical protein